MREPKKTDSVEVRLSTETKTAFMDACRANRTSASAVLRAFIERYLAGNSQAANNWREELRMLSRGNPSRRVAAAGGIGVVVAVAALAVSGPALAAGDPRIAAVFEFMDSDRDGRMTQAEFLSAETKSPPLGALAIILDAKTGRAGETREQLFGRLDADSDRAVSLPELQQAASATTVAKPELTAADSDQDGLLTAGELAAYVTGQKAAAGVIDPAAGAGAFAHSIVAEHDRNGDLMLSSEELAGR